MRGALHLTLPDLVNGVRWSPNGDVVAVACADGHCYLWRINENRVTAVLSRHTDDVNTVAWSPAGDYLATVSEDGTGRIWSTEKGELLDVVLSHGDHCMSVDWQPTGMSIATCGEDAAIRLWKPDGSPLFVWPQPGDLEMVRWNGDGTLLAATCDDGTVKVLSEDGTLAQVFESQAGAAKSVAWSPDGSELAVGAYDCSVTVWDVNEGRLLGRFTWPMLWPRSLHWSPDGLHLSVGGNDGAPIIVDLERRTPYALRCSESTRRAPTFGVNAVASKGSSVLIGADDGSIREWDRSSQSTNVVYEMADDANLINAVDWSPRAEAIAFGSFNGVVGVLVNGKAAQISIGAPVNSVAWHPKEELLAVADYSGIVTILSVTAAMELQIAAKFQPNDGAIKSLSWLDDDRIVTGSTDRSLAIVDRRGRTIQRLVGHGNLINSVAVSSGTGLLVASASRDKTVRIWNPATGRCEHVLTGHAKSVKSVRWLDQSSERLVSGAYDFDVRLWDLGFDAQDEKHCQTLSFHVQGVGTIASEGEEFVTGSWDGSVARWTTDARGRAELVSWAVI